MGLEDRRDAPGKNIITAFPVRRFWSEIPVLTSVSVISKQAQLRDENVVRYCEVSEISLQQSTVFSNLACSLLSLLITSPPLPFSNGVHTLELIHQLEHTQK